MTDSELLAYMTRIGFDADATVSIETMSGLIFRHLCAIPYENIDPLCGIPVSLDTNSLYEKMVSRGRGGYCFEHNLLFAAVLRSLGFDVEVLSAQPRIATPRDQPAPTVHATLLVRMDGERWLVEVGGAGLTPTGPIRWIADIEQETPHDIRRVVEEHGRWFHQVLFEGVWKDVMEFSGVQMCLPDCEIANFYTSQHPDSPFRMKALCSLALPDGERLILSKGRFTHRTREGVARTFEVHEASTLRTVIEREFGICLPADAPLPPSF
jgi:N-hydroxyarylamine O-acetyltransferase